MNHLSFRTDVRNLFIFEVFLPQMRVRNDRRKSYSLKLFLTGIAFLLAFYSTAQTDTAYIARPQDTLKVLATDTAIKVAPDTIVAAKAFSDSMAAHSPKKAAIMSALLPGLGQAYNKKYWKIPVIYAGFATLGFFVKQKSDSMGVYRSGYLAKIDNDSTTIDPFPGTQPEAILSAYSAYRSSRDRFIIFTAFLYVANIIDATVDAHLFTFDVSEDLSFQLQPRLFNYYAERRTLPGFSLTIKL